METYLSEVMLQLPEDQLQLVDFASQRGGGATVGQPKKGLCQMYENLLYRLSFRLSQGKYPVYTDNRCR